MSRVYFPSGAGFTYDLPYNDVELADLVKSYKNFVGENRKISLAIERKVDRLAMYLRRNNIKNVVLGVSGGIDSALVLALLLRVKEIQPLNIHACTFYFSQYHGIFEDKYITDLKNWTGSRVNWIVRDLTGVEDALTYSLHQIRTDSIRANINYALRYTAFFAIAQCTGGVTVGTTNFDEFGYAGWFGKNSDMMVDIQCITDLHKFQVRDMSRELGVPSSVIDRAPTGDLIIKATDEECFGVSYDELSWFTIMMRKRFMHDTNKFMDMNQQRGNVTDYVREKFSRVYDLHEKNSHKYQGQTFNPIFLI